MQTRDHRGEKYFVKEQKAAHALAQNRESKTMHRFLSLRVFWRRGSTELSAILCRMHRNAQYRKFPLMWDSSEWFPADACERCIQAEHSKNWID